MRVIKRDNTYENVDLNKITRRISKLLAEIPNCTSIDPVIISQKVCASLHDLISTSQLDQLASEVAVSMTTIHPDYGTLAAYIVVSDLQKEVSKQCETFLDSMTMLYNNKFLSEEVYSFICSNDFY